MAEGIRFLTDFWDEKYLDEFIPAGGSKIKFVTGRNGSGKTYFLQQIAEDAREKGYIAVSFSANSVWLHDFREIYLEILRQCHIEEILERCADRIIRGMGHDKSEFGEGLQFIDYLSSIGEGDPMNRRELRRQLNDMFLNNAYMDNNFAMACTLLTGGILGYPVLEPASREMTISWLEGDKSQKLGLLRMLGLNAKITKVNARHMLRSLSETIHLAGYPGLLVLIDDLDILQDKKGNEEIRYTKMRRDDAYESIRELIDDIDSMQHIMFIFGFDRIMIDNENTGLKSYQALWMRIQNEISSDRFNRFVDTADLDRLAQQEYSADYLRKLSEEMYTDYMNHLSQMSGGSGHIISEEEAQELIKKARLGSVGIPELVQLATFADQKGEQSK